MRMKIAFLAALALASFTAAPASADIITTTFHAYGSHDPRQCLDGYFSEGAYTNPCNGSAAQKWQWDNTPGVITRIRRVQENRCVGTELGGVGLRTCDPGREDQRWIVSTPDGDGTVVIGHPSTGLCAERNGDGIAVLVLGKCDNRNPAQRWVPGD